MEGMEVSPEVPRSTPEGSMVATQLMLTPDGYTALLELHRKVEEVLRTLAGAGSDTSDDSLGHILATTPPAVISQLAGPLAALNWDGVHFSQRPEVLKLRELDRHIKYLLASTGSASKPVSRRTSDPSCGLSGSTRLAGVQLESEPASKRHCANGYSICQRKRSADVMLDTLEKRSITNYIPEDAGNGRELDWGRENIFHEQAPDARVSATQYLGEGAMTQMFDGSQHNEGTCGQLRKMILVDFLCHEHLEIVFGPRLNFIQGLNGSGKSAVLTAIIVGLGGNASSSQRGSSLRDLIRKDRTVATITIYLANNFEENYLPKVYGDTIIVERTLKSEGTSSYKLMNVQHKVVSRRKDDLDMILEHFSLQVENPVCVMTQDNSRKFLASSSAKDKYRFFETCTLLSTIRENLQLASGQIRCLRAVTGEKQRSLDILLTEMSCLEQKVKDLDRANHMQDDLEALTRKAIWAQIIEQEKRLEAITVEIQELETLATKHVNKQNEYAQRRKTLEDEQQDIVGKLGTVVTELTQHDSQRAESLEKYRKLKAACHDVKKRWGHVQLSVKRKQVEIESLKQDLEANRAASESSNRQEGEAAALQSTALEAELSKARCQEHLEKQKREELMKKADHLNSIQVDAQDNIRQAEQDIIKSKSRLRTLTGSKSDRMGLYNKKMPELIRKIQQEQRWHAKPIGPLGEYISVTEPKWSLAIEHAVGKLGTFIVNDEHDARLLKEIGRTLLFTPTMIKLQFGFEKKMYANVTDACDSPFPTLFSKLNISDPNVANHLLDHAFHQVVLVPSISEALDFAHQRPKSFQSAYMPDGGQVAKGARYYANKSKYPSRILANDFAAEAMHLKHAIAEAEQKLSASKEHQQSVLTDMQPVKQHILESQQTIKQLGKIVARLECELESLRQQMAALAKVSEKNGQTVAEQLISCTAELDILQQDESKLKLEVAERTDRLRMEKEAIQPADGLLRQHEETLQRLKERNGEISDLLLTINKKVKKCDTEIQGFTNRMTKLLEDRDLQGHRTESLLRTAEEKGLERIAPKESALELDQQIIALTNRIQQQQRKHGDHIALRRGFLEKKATMSMSIENMMAAKKLAERLEKASELRRLILKQLWKRMTIITAECFNLCLHVQQHHGKLSFENKDGEYELHMKLCMSNDKRSDELKDVLSLSGGERSFATVAFVTSLWTACYSPFHCLDEFDVCMDLVNRTFTMQHLAKVMQDHPSRQVILLTPQSLVEDLESYNVPVTAIRLADPVRENPSM